VAAHLRRIQPREKSSFNDLVNAALPMEHRLFLCSTDGEFARFPGRQRENPLA